jgi:hypothetical protein
LELLIVPPSEGIRKTCQKEESSLVIPLLQSKPPSLEATAVLLEQSLLQELNEMPFNTSRANHVIRFLPLPLI